MSEGVEDDFGDLPSDLKGSSGLSSFNSETNDEEKSEIENENVRQEEERRKNSRGPQMRQR